MAIMAKFIYNFYASLCILTLVPNFVRHVKSQMMPEYDDYPDRPEPPGMDGMDGMDDYGGMGGMGDPRRMGRGGMGGGDPRGRGGQGGARNNEVIIGRKRFKLYEKKRLVHKRAKEFCKKKDGRLAEAKTIEEMRRLETLFMRARMIGMDVWVGADKKEWKKHSMKHVGHPGLNLNNSAMEDAGIKAMMMGGGQKEMCPAISLSTRNIAPVQCVFPLPFICEYDKNRPRTTRKPKPKGNSTTRASKKKKKTKRKEEMKR